MAVQKKEGWRGVFGWFGSIGHRGFANLFPEIEKIDVVVKEADLDDLHFKPRSYGLDDIADEFIVCSHPRCFGGGVRIGQVVRDMVKARKTKEECVVACKGNYGSAKGRSLHGRCNNVFDVKVTIKYGEPRKKKLTPKRAGK
jgi:hypothetical protein